MSKTISSSPSTHISWNEYFMGLALLSAQRSKDPNSKVGACIVNKDYKIVGVGYNGFPTGISDQDLPWKREGEFLETKYPAVNDQTQEQFLVGCETPIEVAHYPVRHYTPANIGINLEYDFNFLAPGKHLCQACYEQLKPFVNMQTS